MVLNKLFGQKKGSSAGRVGEKLGICVPDHRRDKMAEGETEETPMPVLEVEGVYCVDDTFMIKGRMLGGELKKGLKVDFGSHKIEVLDVRSGRLGAEKLCRGERGALFVKTSNYNISAGDIIEFG